MLLSALKKLLKYIPEDDKNSSLKKQKGLQALFWFQKSW